MEIKPVEDYLCKEFEKRVWAKYPPQFKQISDDIKRLESDSPLERALLAEYPEIQYARKIIAIQKRLWRLRNPNIAS